MEYRHRERKHLFLYLEIYDLETGQLLGHLGDISADGLMIIAEHSLPLHQIKKLRIKLPEEEEFTRPFLSLTVETRWAHPDVNPALHCIGCLMVKIKPEDRPVIQKVGELLSFDD